MQYNNTCKRMRVPTHAEKHHFLNFQIKHSRSYENRRLLIFACHTLAYSRNKSDSHINAQVFSACIYGMNRISLNSACQCNKHVH
jgi:hypothetical protein